MREFEPPEDCPMTNFCIARNACGQAANFGAAISTVSRNPNSLRSLCTFSQCSSNEARQAKRVAGLIVDRLTEEGALQDRNSFADEDE